MFFIVIKSIMSVSFFHDSIDAKKLIFRFFWGNSVLPNQGRIIFYKDNNSRKYFNPRGRKSEICDESWLNWWVPIHHCAWASNSTWLRYEWDACPHHSAAIIALLTLIKRAEYRLVRHRASYMKKASDPKSNLLMDFDVGWCHLKMNWHLGVWKNFF